MNENDIKAGQDAAIARLERACMAGGWIAAQIESDDVAEALRYIGDLKSGLAECQGIARDAIDALSRAEGEIDRLTEQLNHYRMAAEAEAGLADRMKDERDAALADLEWVVSNSGIRIQGRGDSWSALDCRNGLTFIVRDVPTMRDAIAAARSKLDGVKP